MTFTKEEESCLKEMLKKYNSLRQTNTRVIFAAGFFAGMLFEDDHFPKALSLIAKLFGGEL